MRFKSAKNIWFKISNWESWHYRIKYIPIAPFWLWYCLKARSFWFFTASNPTITFGGFEGEGKKEIYDQLPEDSFPNSIYVDAGEDFNDVTRRISEKEIALPFVVKPDVGAMGFLFRKIDSFPQLRRYHDFIGETYIIQDWIDYPVELSVFYYRMPHEKKGVISGMLMKEPPVIKGDGRSTLSELIFQNETLKLNYDNICHRHPDMINKVLPAGKRFVISHAGNRSQGGKLKNLDHEIDEKLSAIFDKISLHSKHFFYGRFDIKCKSLESLKNGDDFSILEYNGSGAGIQHIYGNNLSLFRACKMIVHHWKKLYQISRHNNQEKKIAYWKFSDGRRFLNKSLKHLKKLKLMDEQFPV